MTAQMKTVLVRQVGGPEALEYVDVPRPDPGPRDIVIRAEAFGVGQPDVLIRRGVYKWMPPLPVNPGNDVAGTVSAIGSEVAGMAIGQKVLLSARDLAQRGGCYSEFVAAPADAVHLLADSVDLQEAVCLANYQVAWALLPSIDEQMGDVLLRIFGGATDGPPDQFTARSLLRAIAAGMIARCSPALSRVYGANSGRQLHYCNKFRKQ